MGTQIATQLGRRKATVHEGDVHELDPSRWKAPDNTLRVAARLGDAQLAENVEQVAQRLVCTGAVETENSRRPQSQPALGTGDRVELIRGCRREECRC